MIIGVDCRLWNETGVGRYTRNLVENLLEIDKSNQYVFFISDQKQDAFIAKFPILDSSRVKIVKTNLKWHSISEQVIFPKVLNKENLDIMHFPYFSVPIAYTKPYIVTVHDLIVNKFNTGRASTLPYPLYAVKRIGYNIILANAIYRSKKIIVPSNSVKNDLLNTYRRIKSSKVEVTYEGGMEHNIPRNISKSALIEGKYLVRVGNFYPHKNVERLLSAFHDFIYEDYDNHATKLVLVGKKDYFFKRIEKLIETLNIGANVVFFENVKDEELVQLYYGAIATVVPSLMEGFSLTALEALGCGSPALLSDIPVHREICEDAAIYFNPGQVSDIKQKINFACTMVDESRDELIEQGRKQAKKFSWKKMASETLQIYMS